MKSGSFVISVTFPVKSSILYRAFLDTGIHSAFTGGEAHIDDSVGGKFSAWDGYITGITVGLEENRRISQRWRTSDFADTDEDSILEMEFEENEGETRLTLKHSNLPEGTEDEYRTGWEDFYFAPLRVFLDSRPKKA